MDFDISYLLFLQNIRESTGGIFDEFFNALSKFAVDILPFLGYIIFWSVSKKWGYRFMVTVWCGEVLNGLLKLTVCAYRPWIRSDKINPAGDSKVAATGYSFPSGHSTVATINYGTTFAWQRKKRLWLAIVCAVLILLTCFSRNYLGVHTPQDVLVGFSMSAVLIFVVGFVQKKLEGSQKAVDVLTFAGIAAVIGILIFVMFKPYPMDYDANGKLLVDPQRMMNDTFKACGGFIGLMIGSHIERHFIHYEIPAGAAALPLLTCVGFALMFAWEELLAPATIVLLLGSHWGNMIAYCMMVFFAVALWPLVIKKACKLQNTAADTATIETETAKE